MDPPRRHQAPARPDLRPPAHRRLPGPTRKPRPGERDGVHYFFVDNEEFDKLIANGEL
ncbi:guanylate kinase, partial [Streptomyces sp. NPDC001880]